MELVCVRIGVPSAIKQGNTVHATPVPGDGLETITLESHWTLELPEGSGDSFPVDVLEGWEGQGFPGYSGVGRYTRRFEVPSGDGPILLTLPVVNTAVEVRVNDVPVGKRAWAPYEFVIGRDLLRDGENDLELRIFSAAGNKYYGGTPFQDQPEPSGLGGAPTLRILDPAGS
jgi:hypothetical protein